MTRLFINYFHSDTRKAEYIYTLKQNLSLDLIDQVFVLTEDTVPVKHKKLVVIKGYSRATFQDFFGEINREAKDDDISIIANLDIFFDQTLEHALKMNPNQVYALSRWDLLRGEVNGQKKLFNTPDSQDSWIFKGKVRDVDNCDFPLGKWGCDNRIAHELCKSYDVYNPSCTIITTHLHKEDIRPDRSPENVIDPPYYRIAPHA